MDKCEWCRYFQSAGIVGECRRNAPVTTLSHENPGMPEKQVTLWPLVGADDWCGEYREDHSKSKRPAL